MSRKTHNAATNTIELRPRRRRLPAAWQANADRRHAEDRMPRLTVVRPVAKTALTPGTVVWAHISFEDSDGWKLRPVVVSHTSGREVVVYRGTTADTRFRYAWSYRELTDLASAGLRRATGIYLEPITIDLIDIVGVAGELGPDDRFAVFGAEYSPRMLGQTATHSVAALHDRRTLEVPGQGGLPSAA